MTSSTFPPPPTTTHTRSRTLHLPASSWLRNALRRVVQVPGPGPGPMTGAWGGGAACRLSLGTCCKRRSGSRSFPNGRALPGLRFPQSPAALAALGFVFSKPLRGLPRLRRPRPSSPFRNYSPLAQRDGGVEPRLSPTPKLGRAELRKAQLSSSLLAQGGGELVPWGLKRNSRH